MMPEHRPFIFLVMKGRRRQRQTETGTDAFNVLKTPNLCDIGVQIDSYGMMEFSDVVVDQTDYHVK